MSNIENRLKELFEIADIYGNLAIKVLIDDKGGIKTYLTNDIDEPPTKVIELNGEKEEKIFKMFRYPDLEHDVIKQSVRRKIERGLMVDRMLEKGMKLEEIGALDPSAIEDYYFKSKYFAGQRELFWIRSELRNEWADVLIQDAKRILGVVETKPEEPIEEAKPIYKSKTVITNVLAIIIVALLRMVGIEISAEQVVAILGSLNVILRAITKQPIKLR
ncbi:MAG: hypothetical protein QW101_07480 [Ignisphaera sp.]